MSLLTTLLDATRRLPGRAAPRADDGRRRFFRRAGTLGAAAVGGGLLLPDDAWAAAEARAARLGITPGTVVDAAGRPMESRGAQPFVGEISLVGWNFAARGWALCEGQLLAISSNDALFSLLGTTFGGDGRTTFGLPDLRGRGIVGVGNGPGLPTYRWGEKTGAEMVTLTSNTIPSHTHQQPVSTDPGATRVPANNVPAVDGTGDRNYHPTPTPGEAWSGMTLTGGSQPHENRPPYLPLNYQIALTGVYPSRS